MGSDIFCMGLPQRSTADCSWDRTRRVVSRVSVLAAASLFAWSCGDGTTDPPEANNSPVASGTIPSQTVYVGNTVTLRLSPSTSVTPTGMC